MIIGPAAGRELCLGVTGTVSGSIYRVGHA
jgi:hypothetical protein